MSFENALSPAGLALPKRLREGAAGDIASFSLNCNNIEVNMYK
jgi:hypothetical protein